MTVIHEEILDCCMKLQQHRELVRDQVLPRFLCVSLMLSAGVVVSFCSLWLLLFVGAVPPSVNQMVSVHFPK